MTAKGVTPFWESARKYMRIQNEYVRESIAEILGTMILMFFVCGCEMHRYIQLDKHGIHEDSMQPILGQMFGLLAAILITGGISGAHFNPAVTLGLAIAGECSWLKLPLYTVCQMLGAYLGAGLAASVYWWVTVTDVEGVGFAQYFPAKVFSPISDAPIGSGFIDQIFTTAVLLMLILACIDPRNMGVPKHLVGFYVILTVSGLIMCFGYTAGAALNPARDLGPRLMALTVGYPVKLIMYNNGGNDHWWTVGFFGPLIGGALGAVLYIVLIGAHLNEVDGDNQDKLEQTAGADWRTTHFIPKAQSPAPNTNKSAQNEGPYNNQGRQGPGGPQYEQQQQFQDGPYFENNNGPQYTSNNNNAYGSKEDVRYRQGY